MRWLLAALHLLALGIGLGAIFARGRALHQVSQEKGLPSVFLADNLWGLAAFIWIATGLLRAFGGFEKGSAYYLQSTIFWIKMGLFLIIFLLEIRPMVNFIRWRKHLRAGTAIDTTSARHFAQISYVQAGLIILIVLAATAMARGIDF